jgi:hypothetical protein
MLQVHLSRFICALTFCLAAFFSASSAQAQFFGQQAVGGVSINSEGVLSAPTATDIRDLRDYLATRVKKTSPELAGKTELRMVSLRAVCDALKAAQGQKYEDLPPALMYLGGIQRLQYIFVYPEEKDIVLAGPGEGWKVGPDGNIVGETTNRPVLILHDLLVALQTTDAARQGGVSCSIDPTEQGRKNLDTFLSQQKVMHEGVPGGVEKALGRQVISLNGVPKSSHFARTLVSADYQMKRLAMKLEDSPLPTTLPSFLDMLTKSNVRITNMMPRWWMACNYEPIGRGDEGLSWEIRGPGVKVMTEDELIEAGAVKQTGKADPLAQKWADAMTQQYDKLSEKKPVFTELRNIMDLCVAAAIISKEDLAAKAGLDLTLLSDDQNVPQPEEFPNPRFIDSRCTLMKRGKEWVITASGGVDINSWQVTEKVVDDAKLNAVRTRGVPTAKDRLVWDGK